MKASYKYVFNRRGLTVDAKPIELKIYFPKGAVSMYINTNIAVEDKFWDAELQQVRRKHPQSVLYNQYLADLRLKIENAELEALSRGEDWNKEAVREVLSGTDRASKDNFIAWCRAKNSEEYKRGLVSFETWKKYDSNFNQLQQFADERGGMLKFADLQEQNFCAALDIWLNGRYQPTTAQKFIKVIKKFCKQALIEGRLVRDPFISYRARVVKTTERSSLTVQELAKLEGLNRSQLEAIDPWLVVVLDKFLLSCYCGLRIGDSQLLSPKHIIETEEGLVIDMVTEKMQGQRVILPLRQLFAGKGEIIVARYLREHIGTTLFPSLSDQKVNQKLKVLAAMAGIDSVVTFHTARHTCASMIAEATGNPFVIMKILGHSDIKTSMIYIHNSQSAIVTALQHAKW